MKKHDENKDVRLLSRIAKISNDKTIKISKSQTIGIHAWAKIDYLTHYCGYVLIWDNSAGIGMSLSASERADNVKKNAKKAAKRENTNTKSKKMK